MGNAKLDESQAGIKTAGRNINSLRYTDDTTLGRKWWGWKRRVKMLAWNSTFKNLRWWHLVSSTHGKQKSKSGNSDRFYFGGLQYHCTFWWQTQHWKTLAPWKKTYEKPRQPIKKQRYQFIKKGTYSQSYGFSSSNVRMWELDHKAGRAPKNCFWTMAQEKTFESPLDIKENQTSQYYRKSTLNINWKDSRWRLHHNTLST